MCILYSGTPLFRTSEMRTLRFNGHFTQVRIAFPLTAIHYNPWNADTPLSVKQTGFLVTLVPGLYKIHSRSHASTQRHLPPLNNSTTGHYNCTGMHSTSLWLAFLASVQQGRALERAFIVVNSMSTNCHAFRKYTGSLWNTDASIFRTCSGGPYGVCIGSTVDLLPHGFISYDWGIPHLPCPIGNFVGWYSANIHHQASGTVLHELFPLLVSNHPSLI